MSRLAHYLIPLVIWIFLLVQSSKAEDFLSPLLAPLFDDVCKDAICGKGTCKASLNHNFSFVCECEPGWKQTPFPHDNDTHRFLPCVVPNCSLDYSCTKALSPSSQVKVPENNSSFFDPCNWAYCGEGSCMKKTGFGHECQCKQGSTNLMNITTFPCFNDCSIGLDCKTLGLNVSNKSSTTGTPSIADSSQSHAGSVGNHVVLMVVLMTLSMLASLDITGISS